ncbi:GDSL-like Lipase/Acylhydrolase family protein [Micromonospora matsumotoense]|uniref:GDSL-like Lipase/Acylhydrolase family protein n=1 Tax=Micromonospora matsumotoense TaxID=121616 RepID=A0A1C4XC75_9ACTN|nr:cellulose binding domain-containing protein [Micromonospora matsumotoense]SCF06153.1 GDSL-like Lipase/Acylhydrolase family protein [Micromonospora matsumotoense]
MRLTRSRFRLAVSLFATATVAATAALAGTAPAQAAAGCRVTYAVTNQWPGGFGASVDLTNLGDPLTSWQLTWSFAAGQVIDQLWNGTVTQATGRVTVTNAGWNGNLGSGASTQFGFGASWNNSSNPVPVDFALNGVPCTGRTTSPTAPPTTAPPTTTPPTTTPPTTTPPTTAPPTTVPPTTAPPASGALDQTSTVGRVKAVGTSAQYTWPGIYFEGRFRGTGVGIVLNDAQNDYVVQIDGATVATLVTPGRTTYWVRSLTNAEHTVRLVKRTESPWAAGEFGGLVAASGGAILTRPAPRSRQIEFIGDSWTAGYGNMSTTRDCNSNGGVTRNSNADVTFGALTAQSLNADYQLTAWSGLGMVRNYNGGGTDNFRTYYETDLQALWNSTVWQKPSTWKPQLVVVGLGINDFSTALNPGERWATIDQLAADYRTAYLAFIDKLRSRYGADTFIVLTYPDLSPTTALASSVQQIVQTRVSRGDTRIRSLYYDDNALGLDKLGCDWHPSRRDDQLLAGALTRFVNTLPLTW